MLSTTSHEALQIKTPMRFHLTQVRMVIIQKSSKDLEIKYLTSLLLGIKTNTNIMEDGMVTSQKSKIDLPYEAAIPLLGIYPSEMKSN